MISLNVDIREQKSFFELIITVMYNRITGMAEQNSGSTSVRRKDAEQDYQCLEHKITVNKKAFLKPRTLFY